MTSTCSHRDGIYQKEKVIRSLIDGIYKKTGIFNHRDWNTIERRLMPAAIEMEFTRKKTGTCKEDIYCTVLERRHL